MPTTLLAEDDPDLREVLTDALTEAGHSVTAVTNGEVARLHLEKGAFDLLITDVRMPGSLNGFELARVARKLCPTIKTICVSAYHDEVAQLGDCDAYLSKPFPIHQLTATTAFILRK
jgi:CheY-like chemotaxis protein